MTSNIEDVLAAQRPAAAAHTFRHLHQASCYWLEGLTWVGDRWGDPRPPLLQAREGESRSQTLARTFEPLLGRLTGEIAGQTIRVTRRHIGDIVIWFGERTVDWNRPVTVEVDGTTVYTGRVTRDVSVALGCAGCATLMFCLGPALQLLRTDVFGELKDGLPARAVWPPTAIDTTGVSR